MLASLGVSRNVRAQLQSHGLGGVQQRHYDRHEYILEKRQALEKWRRHLERLKAGMAPDTFSLTRSKAQKRHARGHLKIPRGIGYYRDQRRQW
jgi:hypothetical protein